MKAYIITEELRKGLLDYLMDKPYKEVAQGIAMLNQLPEHKEAKHEDKK